MESRIVPNDVEDPRSWGGWKKFGTIMGGILASFTAVFGTSVYVASVPGVVKDFHVSETLSISLVSIYSIGQVVGPAITTTTSELFGRRIVLRISILASLFLTIGAASAPNFASLAVLRLLASIAVSPCPSVALGQINDLWDVKNDATGTYMVLLAAMATILPAALGMVCGALIAETRDWRWTFWLTAMLLGAAHIALIPISETYLPEIIRKQSRKGQRYERGNWKALLKVSFVRPFQMLAEPIIFPTALVSAFAQAIVFYSYAAYPVFLTKVYGFSLYQVGLSFLPISVGNILAVPLLGMIDRLVYKKRGLMANKSATPIAPEPRLAGAIVGGLAMPASLFWIGWTARKSIHSIIPLLSGVLFGIAYTLILISYAVYKNDIYGEKFGASAFSAEVMMRYLLSAPVPLFTVQMIDRLGFDWSMTLVGFIACALLPVPWIFVRYGPALRQKSRTVPVADDPPMHPGKVEDLDIAGKSQSDQVTALNQPPPITVENGPHDVLKVLPYSKCLDGEEISSHSDESGGTWAELVDIVSNYALR